jgi:tetratricopeptide (TPR) repeat protein
MADLSGAVVGERYTIEREIGRGGMATIWLGRDSHHERDVAIKVLHPDLAGAQGADRFVRELRLTAQLQHPNIVPILDSGVTTLADGTRVPWYAMPYLKGESLRERLRRQQQLSLEESLHITEAVGRALEAAHRQHVGHRDIKPENILLAGDQVYVVDFGIAKALDVVDADRLTKTGIAVGTPAYMSPEQSVAGTVDLRTDQYSLATVLYEMLAGEPPFTGANTQAIFARRLQEPARSLRTVRTAVPESVEQAVLRALERTPADRFDSITEFLRALRTPSVSIPALRARAPWTRVAVAAAALVIVAGAVAWALSSRPRAAAVDPQVIAIVQRAQRVYANYTPDGANEAIASLRSALALDSTYAPAWNALAKAYTRAYQRWFPIVDTPRDRLLQLGVVAVDRSLALDSLNADTWMTRAILTHQVDPIDVAPALKEIRRAIELDSTFAPPWHHYAVITAELGEVGSALEKWRRCVQLDPAYTQCLSFMSIAHQWRGNADSAATWADSSVAMDPRFGLARENVAAAAMMHGDFARAEASYQAWGRLVGGVDAASSMAGAAAARARQGRTMEARALLRDAEKRSTELQAYTIHNALYFAAAHAALGDADRALRALAAYQPVRDAHLQLHLRCDPILASLHDDRRFRALLVIPLPAGGKGC